MGFLLIFAILGEIVIYVLFLVFPLAWLCSNLRIIIQTTFLGISVASVAFILILRVVYRVLRESGLYGLILQSVVYSLKGWLLCGECRVCAYIRVRAYVSEASSGFSARCCWFLAIYIRGN